MKKHAILLVIAMGILPISLPAQQPTQTFSELYSEGERLFLHHHYAAAQQKLIEALNSPTQPKDDQTLVSEIQYMIVCTAYHLKENDRIDQLNHFLENNPNSPHTNHLQVLIGNCLYEEGKYEDALNTYELCNLELLGDEARDEATLYKAICLLKTGDRKEAYALLTVIEECSEKYPIDAAFYKAYINYVQQQYDLALSTFSNLHNHPIYGDESQLYTAEIYLNRKEYKQAITITEEHLQRNPQTIHHSEMMRIAGESAYGMKNYIRAVELLTNYIEDCESPTRSTLYKMGMSKFHLGVYSEAAAYLFRVSSEQDALTQNTLLHSGLSYIQLRDMIKARMSFEQASTMNFDQQIKEQALYNYALCIHETSYTGFGESVGVFERFLNEFPHSKYCDLVNEYLVDVYMNTRSYKTALQSIAKIKQPGVKILEARQKIHYRLGTEAYANADYRTALEYFNRSLQDARYDRQTHADAYFWRGESRYKLGNYNGAIADFLQYLATSPASNPAQRGITYYNLGYAFFQQQDYTKARNYFDKFLTDFRPHTTPPIIADAMSRKGDCYFYVRDFTTATKAYAEAVETHASQGAYALYQQGFVKGLQKDYMNKVVILNKLIDQHPQSDYVDDALYEQGRAYVQMEQNDHAIRTFNQLITKYPESVLSKKASNEIGLLYYQNEQYENAIDAYKQVIEKYPGSEEAQMAQRDLRNIYIEQNKVNEYASYVSSQKGAINLDNEERDSLTYLAAEKVYMRGDIAEAKRSLEDYIKAYPNGINSLNAHYYLGLIAYQHKNEATALTHMNKVLEFPDNKYSEEAMLIAAELYFNAKDYPQSLSIYKMLRDRTTSTSHLLTARTGVLRAAYLTGNFNDVNNTTEEFLSDNKTSPELTNEARYYRSKLAAQEGLLNVAENDLNELSKDTRNIYGAEAKYRLAEMYYKKATYDKAENILLEYIENSTPHAYWLARSFVLLADVYLNTNREIEAKQYLLSLQQNYSADDDIAARIQERLNKIQEKN